MTTPLVLLHGFLGCADDFAALRAELEPAVPCAALDLPGHGARPVAVTARDFEGGVELVRERIAALGIARCHLLGYSMGGRLALGLVASAPGLVASAVVIGAGAGIEDAAERRRRRAADDALADRLEREDLGDFLRAWYGQELFATLRGRPDFAAVLERRRRGRPPELAAALRALGTGTQPCLRAALAGASTPILLVAGALDAKYVDSNARLAEHLPRCACRTVPGAGHGPHLEEPRRLARIVRDFLARQQEQRGGIDPVA